MLPPVRMRREAIGVLLAKVHAKLPADARRDFPKRLSIHVHRERGKSALAPEVVRVRQQRGVALPGDLGEDFFGPGVFDMECDVGRAERAVLLDLDECFLSLVAGFLIRGTLDKCLEQRFGVVAKSDQGFAGVAALAPVGAGKLMGERF